MTKTEIRKTGEFEAIDDKGIKHTIVVRTTFIITQILSGERDEQSGTKMYRLRDGSPVNIYADGSLENVRTGQKMTRIVG